MDVNEITSPSDVDSIVEEKETQPIEHKEEVVEVAPEKEPEKVETLVDENKEEDEKESESKKDEEEKEPDSKQDEKTLVDEGVGTVQIDESVGTSPISLDEVDSPDDLTVEIVKHYMRIDHTLDDFELAIYLKSALSYVRKYVNKDGTDEKLDIDLIIPVLMLVAHFYENKSTLNVNNAKLDDIFKGVLWMERGVVL